jgi:hypothetical protein
MDTTAVSMVNSATTTVETFRTCRERFAIFQIERRFGYSRALTSVASEIGALHLTPAELDHRGRKPPCKAFKVQANLSLWGQYRRSYCWGQHLALQPQRPYVTDLVLRYVCTKSVREKNVFAARAKGCPQSGFSCCKPCRVVSLRRNFTFSSKPQTTKSVPNSAAHVVGSRTCRKRR